MKRQRCQRQPVDGLTFRDEDGMIMFKTIEVAPALAADPPGMRAFFRIDFRTSFLIDVSGIFLILD